MNIFALISLLVTASAVESFLYCFYEFHQYPLPYRCVLSIYNPDGLNNFSEINGEHLDNFTNADVTELNIISNMGSITTNVPSIICDTFPNLVSIALNNAGLTEIGDEGFASCSRVERLRLDSNNITSITSNAFTKLGSLDNIDLSRNNLTTLPDSFVGLEKLRTFLFTNNDVSQIQSRAFTGLTNLEFLNLNANKLTELHADTFFDLKKLTDLFIDNNPIEFIDENAFRGLDSLLSLNLQGCKISQIQSNHFQHSRKLTSIILSDNQIEELSEDIFSALDLRRIGVAGNRLKILHRNSFGSLWNLYWLSVNNNEIYAVDRAIIDDAANMGIFFFYDNSCASFDSRNFESDRTQLLPELEKCFDNYKGINDTTTTEGNEYTTKDTTTEHNEDITTEGNQDTTTEHTEHTTTEGNEDTTTEHTEDATTDYSENTTTEPNQEFTTPENQIIAHEVVFGNSFTYYVFLLYFFLFCALLFGSFTMCLILKSSAKNRGLGYSVK